MNAAGQNAYPPAPWVLRGGGVATLGLVDLAQARSVTPPGARVVQVWPGKTLGGLLFGAYGEGSSLQYNELNLVAALVRFEGRLAFWLPRLYVDSPSSRSGGRAIWGAPKELADFAFTRDGVRSAVAIVREGRTVCHLTFGPSAAGARLALPMPAVGLRDGVLLAFTGRLAARFSLTSVEVAIPADAEFAGLRLDCPFVGVRCDALELVVPPPRSAR